MNLYIITSMRRLLKRGFDNYDHFYLIWNKWRNCLQILWFIQLICNQQALTDGAVGEDPFAAVGRSLFPQSLPLLNPKAAINFSFHRPLSTTAAAVDDGRPQPCSAGNRCFKHTFIRQVLQTQVLENVRISRHRLTAHVGFFFLLGSQSPDSWCLSKILVSSPPSFPVVSIDVEQISQTTTFRLFRSDLGQSWDFKPRCSKQNTFTFKQFSEIKKHESSKSKPEKEKWIGNWGWNLLATVAGEGEEIELVAIGVLAVAAEIGESLCSSGGGHGDLFVGRFRNWKWREIRSKDEIVEEDLVC